MVSRGQQLTGRKILVEFRTSPNPTKKRWRRTNVSHQTNKPLIDIPAPAMENGGKAALQRTNGEEEEERNHEGTDRNGGGEGFVQGTVFHYLLVRPKIYFGHSCLS